MRPKDSKKEVRSKRMLQRRKRVVALYKKGFSCNKIAIKLQIHPNTVYEDLRAMGRHIKVQKTKEKRNAAIIKERCNGKTIRELSLRFKITESRVNEIIDNYNKTAKYPVPDFQHIRNIRLNKLKGKPIRRTPGTRLETFKPKFENPKLNKTKTETIPAPVRLKQILAMRKSGIEVTSIAEKFNLSRNRIYQLLKANEASEEKSN
ncbi:MAG: helix-turn-helix domain-containing protein [Planctomycetaceae bacterium]|jgi:transposase|nr:helix-turn-helix domain-containing protein [Planctomycetaceae bacterium]